jgi:hypothetical protein
VRGGGGEAWGGGGAGAAAEERASLAEQKLATLHVGSGNPMTANVPACLLGAVLGALHSLRALLIYGAGCLYC